MSVVIVSSASVCTVREFVSLPWMALNQSMSQFRAVIYRLSLTSGPFEVRKRDCGKICWKISICNLWLNYGYLMVCNYSDINCLLGQMGASCGLFIACFSDGSLLSFCWEAQSFSRWTKTFHPELPARSFHAVTASRTVCLRRCDSATKSNPILQVQVSYLKTSVGIFCEHDHVQNFFVSRAVCESEE